MKKLLIVGLVIATTCGIATVTSAHGPWDGPPPGHQRHEEPGFDPEGGPRHHRAHGEFRERERAREVLEETADTLERAQWSARRGHYRDGLGRAWAHQEEARDLYFNGEYERAIAHSMRARDIAVYIIDANRRGPGGPHRHHFQEHELDNQLHVRIVDDNVALKLRFNLN